MTHRQRFPTARRRWIAGKVPLTAVLVGPPSPRAELLAAAALHADAVAVPVDIESLLVALEPRPGPRFGRLVLFELGEPHYTALDAIRSLRATRGLRLVTWSERLPHDAWTQVLPHQIECRLTQPELVAYVQAALGGALGVTATELCDRVGWDTEAAMAAVRRLTLAHDRTSLGDVRQLVAPDPELHFIAALTSCDRGEAYKLAAKVREPAVVLVELERRLVQLLALGEVRPASHLARSREMAGRLNMAPETIAMLAPVVRLYSRQKVAQRLDALSVIDAELQRGTPNVGLLEALCALW